MSNKSICSDMDLEHEEMETTQVEDDDENHEYQSVIKSNDEEGYDINDNKPTEEILPRSTRRDGLRNIQRQEYIHTNIENDVNTKLDETDKSRSTKYKSWINSKTNVNKENKGKNKGYV